MKRCLLIKMQAAEVDDELSLRAYGGLGRQRLHDSKLGDGVRTKDAIIS